MKELLIAMVEELVNDKEAVQVTVDDPKYSKTRQNVFGASECIIMKI